VETTLNISLQARSVPPSCLPVDGGLPHGNPCVYPARMDPSRVVIRVADFGSHKKWNATEGMSLSHNHLNFNMLEICSIHPRRVRISGTTGSVIFRMLALNRKNLEKEMDWDRGFSETAMAFGMWTMEP
jgi:hypothetical protein